MLRIVIVDDEPSVLEGLHIFLGTHKKNGYDIVGQASDGKAAFPVICRMRPDLVICDIRMPGLTGLELIEKVNSEIKPVPKFIMLSGYNDFAYAKKAMQSGAIGYMTKPLDPEELERELARATEIIENENKINRENLELIRYTANQLYNDVISGKRSDKLARKAGFIFNMPERAKMSIIRFITITGGNEQSRSNCIYDLLMSITGIRNENCIFYNGNGSYIIIIHEGMEGLDPKYSLTESWSRRLGEIDPDDYGLQSYWVLMSGTCNGGILENISECTKQLDQLHMYCMLHPENTIVSYDAMDKSSLFQKQAGTEKWRILPDTLYDNVVDAIKGSDADKVRSAIEDLFIELYRTARSDLVFSVCLYRLADVVRKVASSFGIEAGKDIMAFTASISIRNPNCKSLALAMCSHVYEKLNSNNDKSLVMLENEIIDYIKADFAIKNLSIQLMADHFSLPAIIISKIVKKKTGRKFNDYINYLRIEYAKMLFASKELKITAVCDEVGYSDYGYFTKKFKELTGILPSEYKKKYT
ncbi:MAG: response regulator [Clostridiaceae bacterium]|nr:response regulator [Clostridiaceae bacterium]